jgi:hypothetical protein
MKKLLLLIFILSTTSIFSQLSLNKEYYYLKSEIEKTNNVVIKISYLNEPVSLIFSKEINLTDYAKTFMFNNKRCISENHLYPLSQFNTQKTLLKFQYGTPKETYNNGSLLYVWNTSDGLTVSLTKKYNSIPKKKGVSIIYSYDKDIDKVMKASQYVQSGMAEMEYVKMQE